MLVEYILFRLDDRAADGSRFPSQVVTDYLTSKDYLENVQGRGLAFIGITHKDRKKDLSHLEVAADDGVLINKNNVGHIIKIEVRGDVVIGTGVLYDPKKFTAGPYRESLEYIRNLHEMGVYPPISIAVEADWSAQEVCLKILEFRGLDYTLGPSFKSAGTSGIDAKYSYVPTVKTISKAKTFSVVGVEKTIRKVKNFSSNSAKKIEDERMTELLNKTIPDTINREEFFTPMDASVVKEIKIFSLTSISERLKLTPKQKFGKTIAEYKSYASKVGSSISNDELKDLSNMFTNDVLSILTSSADKILSGTSIVSLLGLKSVGDTVADAAIDLDPWYRKFVTLNKSGNLSKEVTSNMQKYFDDFMNALKEVTFSSDKKFEGKELNEI